MRQIRPPPSDSQPFALATKAQPPPMVVYLPPGGVGSLNTPYLKSGTASRNCAIAQMPVFIIAQ